jgi:hypothetical protein
LCREGGAGREHGTREEEWCWDCGVKELSKGALLSVEKKELRRERVGKCQSDLRIALFGESQQLWLGGCGVSWRVPEV